jgi:hypothetical protein
MKPLLNRIVSLTAAAVAITMFVGPAFAGPASKVARFDNDTGAMGEASYIIDAPSKHEIKYEAKGSGLGENGADQTDLFVIDVSKISSIGAISVKTKADTTDADSTVHEAGDSRLDSQGFRVTVESLTTDQLVISVRSDSSVSALSHVSFGILGAMYD